MGVKSHTNDNDSLFESAVSPLVDEKPATVKSQVPAKNEVTVAKAATAPVVELNNVSTDPGQFVAFAQTLIGTPYAYGSMDPSVGFDCSGFINYVAAHFNIKVPRSSIDFTNAGREITADDAKQGDLILFTGTDSTNREVGHIGIVTGNMPGQQLEFIHSSSGKANGVTISNLEGYYSTRFVKVIRILS